MGRRWRDPLHVDNPNLVPMPKGYVPKYKRSVPLYDDPEFMRNDHLQPPKKRKTANDKLQVFILVAGRITIKVFFRILIILVQAIEAAVIFGYRFYKGLKS